MWKKLEIGESVLHPGKAFPLLWGPVVGALNAQLRVQTHTLLLSFLRPSALLAQLPSGQHCLYSFLGFSFLLLPFCNMRAHLANKAVGDQSERVCHACFRVGCFIQAEASGHCFPAEEEEGMEGRG